MTGCNRLRIVECCCENCGNYREIKRRCGRKFCSKDCESRWASVVRDRVEKIVNLLFENAWAVTLTIGRVKTKDELTDRHRLFVNSFKHLRRLVFWKVSVSYGFYVFELVGDKQTGYNLHLHLLVKVKGRGIDSDELRSEWSRIVTSGERLLETHVQPVNDVHKSINYCTKGSNVFDKDIQDRLSRKKCFSFIGFTDEDKEEFGLSKKAKKIDKPRNARKCHHCGSSLLKFRS